MPRPVKPDEVEITSIIFLAASIVVVGLVFVMFLRLQRGWLGPVLAVSATVLLIYWLRELRTTGKPKWLYDMIDDGEAISFVAEVPGPEDEVQVTLRGRRLHVKGRNGFRKTIKLKEDAEIVQESYANGVLTVTLKRPRIPAA